MTERELRTNSSTYNLATRQKQLIHEEYNSAYNHPVIIDAIKAGRAFDMVDYPKVSRTPAIIIGSGPSLDEALPHLRNWEGGIFCTSSHAVTLMYHGIEPTHIVALDPFCTWEEIDAVDWSATDTKLVTHPGVWPTLIHNWPNDMILYRQNAGSRQHYYAQQQHRMYTDRETLNDNIRDARFRYYIRTEVTLFACSPPAQMFVADRLGYGTIFLSGVDFCYHSGKTRFTGIRRNEKGEYEELRHVMPEEIPDSYIKTDSGGYSETVHLYYKKNLLTAWRLSEQNVYTTDKNTALIEIVYKPIEEVVRKQGKGYPRQKPKEISRRVEEYLVQIGCFVIEGTHGKAFIESDDPETQIPEHMRNMNRQLACENCGYEARAKDDEDYTGDPCPQCGNGTMARLSTVDVDANMRRIRRLLRK